MAVASPTVVAGDTIEVLPGTYAESVTVNKSLELRGAQEGIDGRNRVVDVPSESRVRPPAGTAGFTIADDGVTLDGFRIEGGAQGIDVPDPGGVIPIPSGHEIVNNVVTGSLVNIRLNSDGGAPSRSVVRRNQIEGALITGDAGIYSDLGISNAEISDNLILSHERGAIVIDGTDTSAGLDIHDNRLIVDSGVYLENATSVDFIGNDLLTPASSRFNALVFGGKVSGATVRKNRLIGNGDGRPSCMVPPCQTFVGSSNSVIPGSNAVVLVDNGAGPNSQVQLVGNTILDHNRGVRIAADGAYEGRLKVEFNRIVRTGRGIDNKDSDATEQVDADNNWWGCNKGPNDDLNRCDNVSPNVNFDPWLKLSIEAAKDKIETGGESTQILGTLTRNSAGDEPTSFFPDRTSLAFDTTVGDIRKRARTLDGVARNQLSSSSKNGTARVQVKLDSQRKRTRVEIEEQAKKKNDGKKDK